MMVMSNFNKEQLRNKIYFTIILLIIATPVRSQELTEINEVLARLETRSNDILASDSIIIMDIDSIEASVLGFLQSVGDLNIVQYTQASVHGKCTWLNATEVINIMDWYKSNQKYFTDEMYSTYCKTIANYPMYYSNEERTIYVYRRTDSINYQKTIEMLKDLRREFLKAKYPNIDLSYE